MKPINEFQQPRYYLNRELSWLAFNERVLELASMERTPLLEKLKFLSIFSDNLDEFYMIRVANFRELEVADHVYRSSDGMTPVEHLVAIADRAQKAVAHQYDILEREVLPALEERGVELVSYDELSPEDRSRMADYFTNQVFPVLTPLTVDPSHPFPYLANLSLNLIVTLAPVDGQATPGNVAIVEVPEVLDRLIEIDAENKETKRFITLDDVIRNHIGDLFPGLNVTGTWEFRITRNSDLSLEEQEVENLLQDIERELRTRSFRPVVRVEAEKDMPEDLLEWLLSGCQATKRELFRIDGLLHLPSLMKLYRLEGFDDLKDPPFNPRLSPRMAKNESIFRIIRQGDLLLHHPYESFSTVAELIGHASWDPKVLAIKLTLYRTSGDSVIIRSLKEAAQNGKQVTAVVELKARFDEKNNIDWARELERAGAHVVYGMVGLKTHCKTALVVRNEHGSIRRYVHISTGNYNSTTAKLYTDLGVMTCDTELAEDVSHLFNVLTSYSRDTMLAVKQGKASAPKFNKLAVAPFHLRNTFERLIDEEIELHSDENPGLIRAKCNALSDARIIAKLYRAASEGVRVELNVRGICRLIPGIEGVSENIRVVSVLDRFLEHSRIYHFGHGGEDLVFFGSADWMSRNLDRRVEAVLPVHNEDIKKRLLDEILTCSLSDNQSAWELQNDGTYKRISPREGEEPVRSQYALIEAARHGGLKQPDYETALREPRIPRNEDTAEPS
jgi:polyphosphate kinase